MLLMAYTYQNNLAYGLTFFLGAFGSAGMYATHRFLESVIVEPRRSPLTIVDRPFAPPFATPELEGPPSALELRPRKSAVFQFKDGVWIAKKRGLHSIHEIDVTTTFPTGMFRAWRRIKIDGTILTAPAPQDFGLLPKSLVIEKGVLQKGTHSDPEELEGLQTARPEDPPSKIDWRSVARGRGLLRKDFAGGGNSEIVLRWEETAPLQDVEKRMGQISSWLFTLPLGRKIRVLGPSGIWSQRTDEALEDLARYPSEGPG